MINFSDTFIQFVFAIGIVLLYAVVMYLAKRYVAFVEHIAGLFVIKCVKCINKYRESKFKREAERFEPLFKSLDKLGYKYSLYMQNNHLGVKIDHLK